MNSKVPGVQMRRGAKEQGGKKSLFSALFFRSLYLSPAVNLLNACNGLQNAFLITNFLSLGPLRVETVRGERSIMGRLFPESATLAPEIHSQNTWDKILNRTGVIIKVLFVTSYICHSIRFHLVLFFLQLRFFQIGIQFLVVM